eukprot:CAMPEP_0172484460 /NCGR_PEP_ID=MMETSP1066-20121228/11933_1 /TAXON_ID=671091 /ORGANISM="Coscinodiscus wailesii, Strain CCMP2513" /LENGTH=75 /DNA_ID=CAMNT_0013249003 /DNA_START=159 /DNA_END=386 /DNA_ORIENTATION=+
MATSDWTLTLRIQEMRLVEMGEADDDKEEEENIPKPDNEENKFKPDDSGPSIRWTANIVFSPVRNFGVQNSSGPW